MSDSAEIFDRDTLARVGRLMFRARRVVEGVRAGAHRSPLHGASVEFAEHKEYTPGDELKHIDWKLFGKSDKYYVKRFEEETNLIAHLLIDTSASMGYGRSAVDSRSWWQKLRGDRKSSARFVDETGLTREGQRDGGADKSGRGRSRSAGLGDSDALVTKHDYAILLAASLAYLFVRQGDAVGLFPFGGGDSVYLPPRARPSHLHTVMETLLGLEARGEGHISEAISDFAPRVRRRGVIVLISDLLEDPETILMAMKDLRTHRNDVFVCHVLHSDELSFPYEEVSQFLDPEDPQSKLIADPREIREAYLGELGGFLELVRRRCFEAQVDYMLLDTRMSVATALAEFLARRSISRRQSGMSAGGRL